jgi:hypothetical protein
MMRLVQQRYPERNIVTAGRRAKALYEEEEARLARGEPPRTEPIVDPALGQKVNFKKAPRVEVSQPGFVEVRDSDGEFVGRMSPASASPACSLATRYESLSKLTLPLPQWPSSPSREARPRRSRAWRSRPRPRHRRTGGASSRPSRKSDRMAP